MPTALQTPLHGGQAEKVGKHRYRKQVLPVGHVDHDGKRLDFSPKYLKQLADSFVEGKMDQVPFILVDDSNKHSQDPERVRGDVTGMEVHDDGLFALVDMSDRGDELLKENPKLGVSVRIDQDDMTIEHVAGTVNPVVKGMKPFEALDLSKPNDDVTFFDLSDGEFVESSDAPDSSSGVSKDALTDEDRTTLKAIAAKLGVTDDTEGDGDTAVDKLIADILKAEPVKDDEPEPVALSKEAQDKIDLAQKDAREAKATATKAADDLAAEKWKNTERDYLDAGVPPSMLKLAKPHLSTASSVIELSKGDSQASAMKKLLDEAKGTIELGERGRADAEDQESEEAKAKELASDEAWANV